MIRTFAFLCLLAAIGCGNPVATVTGKAFADGSVKFLSTNIDYTNVYKPLSTKDIGEVIPNY